MKKVLLLVVILLVTAGAAITFISSNGTDVEVRDMGVTGPPSPTKGLQEAPAGPVAEITGQGEMTGSNKDLAPTEEAMTKKDPEFPSVPAVPEETLAMVNDTPVTIGDLLPPGVLQPGDSLPEDAFRKYLDNAVDQRLLVQEAQELGLADTPEHAEMIEDMKNDLSEMSGLSDEQKQWRLKNFSRMALIQELYRKEGLVPERVNEEEADLYYLSHGDEYEWLRKKEALKGSSPDKIERKVKREIKRDLEAPLKQEIREKRSAYAESLRQRADIQILK